jgi:transposase
MIQLTPHMRILVATQPVDMRNQIDGLCGYCRAVLGENPYSGAVFVFTGRNRRMIRILAHDNQGFWLLTKRLCQGKFPYWPKGEIMTPLQAHEVLVLLRGGDPASINALGPWRKIA